MLTRTLALEWADQGIRVNGVLPGPIDGTEGMRRLAPLPEHRQAVIQSVPVGRLGAPADIARACLFLAPEQAACITGAALRAASPEAKNKQARSEEYTSELQSRGQPVILLLLEKQKAAADGPAHRSAV